MTASSGEPTAFLYPFIEAEERDAAPLLELLARSARAKTVESAALRAQTLERTGPVIEAAGAAMAERLAEGGCVQTFGNGGSATDAQGAAELFRRPPYGQALPAVSLVDDQAVVTALANDIGFELVFSRQLIARSAPHDVVIGFSTSGDSPNLLRAFEEATRRDLVTVGLCGYEGSAMAHSPAVQHCLVVRSESVHRIQETQDALLFALWEAVQRNLPVQTAPVADSTTPTAAWNGVA